MINTQSIKNHRYKLHSLVALRKKSIEADNQFKVITRCNRPLLKQNNIGKYPRITYLTSKSPGRPLFPWTSTLDVISQTEIFPDRGQYFLTSSQQDYSVQTPAKEFQLSKHFLRAALEAETNPWVELYRKRHSLSGQVTSNWCQVNRQKGKDRCNI